MLKSAQEPAKEINAPNKPVRVISVPEGVKRVTNKIQINIAIKMIVTKNIGIAIPFGWFKEIIDKKIIKIEGSVNKIKNNSASGVDRAINPGEIEISPPMIVNKE